MHDVTHLGHGDQKSFAGYCRKTVESVHESRGKRRHGAEMPEEFGVLPCRFARGTYTPGSDRIFQVRHGRERITQKTNIQCALGGFDEAVEIAIERSVILVLLAAVLRVRGGDLAGGNNCLRKIVIDMSVDARQSELDASDCCLVAALE